MRPHHIKSIGTLQAPSIDRILLLPDLDLYVACGKDGLIRMWCATTLKKRHHIRLDKGVSPITPPLTPFERALNRPSTAPEPHALDALLGPHSATVRTMRAFKAAKAVNAVDWMGVDKSAAHAWPNDMCYHDNHIVAPLVDKRVLSVDFRRHMAVSVAFRTPNPVQCIIVAQRPLSSQSVFVCGDTKGLVCFYSCHPPHSLLVHGVIHKEAVTKLFSETTVGVISSSLDGTIKICEGQDLRHRMTLRGHQKGVVSFAFSSVWKLIASVGLDRTILLWNPFVHKPTSRIEMAHRGSLVDIALNERHHQIITCSLDQEIKVWDIRSLACVQCFRDESEMSAMAFDHRLQRLVTAGAGIHLWSVDEEAYVGAEESGPAHSDPVVGLAYSSTHNVLITVGSNGRTRLWDVDTRRPVGELSAGHSSHITGVALDHSHRRLLTAAMDGSAHQLGVGSLVRMHTFPPRSKPVTSVCCLSPACGMRPIVTAGRDGRIILMPAQDNMSVFPRSLRGHAGAVVALAECSSGLLASAGRDGRVGIWKASSARLAHWASIPMQSSYPTCLCFLPARHSLAVGMHSGVIHIVHPISGHVFFPFAAQTGLAITGLAADSTNTFLFAATASGDCFLFDIHSIGHVLSSSQVQYSQLSLVRRWKGHDGGISNVCNTGSLFMSGGYDGSVLLWRVDGSAAGSLQVKN